MSFFFLAHPVAIFIYFTILKIILRDACPQTPLAHGFTVRSMSLPDLQISKSQKKYWLHPLPNPGDAPACYGDNSHEDIFENSLPLMRFVSVSLRSSRAENSVAHCYKSIQTKICRAKIVGIQ